MEGVASCSSSNEEGNKTESKEKSSNGEDILPGFQTFDAFRQAAFKSLMEGTRNSNNLPTGKNWDYYTSFPSFGKIMNAEGKKVLELISLILRHQGIKGNIVRRDSEEKFDLIVDANDAILERVGCNLDEMSGIQRNPEPILMEVVGSRTPKPISGSWNLNRTQSDSQNNSPVAYPVRLLAAKNIQRPQIKFKDKIDNSPAPFEPRIKDKPNSLKPLSIMLEISDDGVESFSHPYEYELNRFKPSAKQLKRVTPQMYCPVEETTLIIVEREEQLPSLLEDLAKYSEIAVDLEHHSYRTFQGITCLMQISTRDTDYIIDTLELRDKLHCLNEIFTKPSIVKVFHGADHDIEWLQRDLSLYVVNMFDTHQAAKLLNLPQLSLAFLMKHYCNVMALKHFQLADWRIRSLPEELILYAREDTHYLLYIYDVMQNALLDAANGQDNLVQSVYQQSTEICKKKYEKPVLREDSHMLVYRRNKKLFDNRQLFALKELYRWRDNIARQDDESTGYVLPNHMLLQIAEALPREMQGILACCNPIPPLVRQNLLALHYIVLQAREQPLVKPIMEETSQVRPTTQSWIKVNLDGLLHCPHDLAHQQDFRDDLPTLIEGTLKINNTTQTLAGEPAVTLFEEENDESPDAHARHVTFVCPYERYKKVKPYVQSQEATKAGGSETTEAQEGDDERIQRIRNHFLEVSAQLEKKKRKREEDSKEDETEEEQQQIQDEGPSTNNRRPIEMKHSETLKDLQPLRPKKKKRKNKKSNIQPMDKSENPEANQVKLENNINVNPPKNKKRKKNKEPEEGFQPFDYSKINYAKFQGGSNTNQTNNNVQEKFKAKGKKNRRIGKNKKITKFKGTRY